MNYLNKLILNKKDLNFRIKESYYFGNNFVFFNTFILKYQ